MPEPSERALLLIAPSKVAILTIKFFRNNFHRAKEANKRRGNEFTGHLRIFDVRRAALRTANHSSSDVRVGRFPLDHQTLCSFEVVILHHHFCVRLRARHESDLLQRGFVVNIGLQSCVLKAPFQLPRLCRFVKRGDRHHKFSCLRESTSSDQTSTNGRVQDLAEETICRALNTPAPRSLRHKARLGSSSARCADGDPSADGTLE